jgi:S-adenosylmethionine hydrolase
LPKGRTEEGLDGNVHDIPAQKEYDAHRQEYLDKFGITFCRITNDELMGNANMAFKKIEDTYWKFKNTAGFAKVVTKEDVLSNNGNLSLQLYVKQTEIANEHNIIDLIGEIKNGKKEMNSSLENLFIKLKGIGI